MKLDLRLGLKLDSWCLTLLHKCTTLKVLALMGRSYVMSILKTLIEQLL